MGKVVQEGNTATYYDKNNKVERVVEAPRRGTIVSFVVREAHGNEPALHCDAEVLYGYALLGGTMAEGATLRVDLPKGVLDDVPVFSCLNDSNAYPNGYILRRHVIHDSHIWAAEVPIDRTTMKHGTWHYKDASQ